MAFISAESRRQTGKWKIIPIERLIIIIIIILFSFHKVCSVQPFHRDMNGSNELSHILFQVLSFTPLQNSHPALKASSFRRSFDKEHPTVSCDRLCLCQSRSLHICSNYSFDLGNLQLPFRSGAIPSSLQAQECSCITRMESSSLSPPDLTSNLRYSFYEQTTFICWQYFSKL